MQEFEISGYWYPSDAPYDKKPGTLEFDPLEGLTLEIMGRFRSHTKVSSETEHRTDIDTIFGQTTSGGDVTLTECSIGKYSLPREYDQKSRGTTQYHPEYCFAGDHAEDGPKFKSINFRLTNLDQWIHHTDIEDIEFPLDDNTKFSLSYTTAPPNPQMRNFDEDDYRASFFFDDSLDFESIRSDFIKPFQYLITFGLSVPVFPLRIFGNTQVDSGRPFGKRFPGSRDIEAFSSIGTSVVFPESRYRLRHEGRAHPMWTLAYIEDEVERILQNWYSVYHKHQPLFDLFFTSMYYDDDEYPSVIILNLTRALEAYHRESDRYINYYIPEKEYKEYREVLENTIPEDFPDQFTDHLKDGTFKFANRVSLRKRLKDIIEDQEEVLQYRFGEELDSSAMASEIKEIRNDLTHLSDEDISEFNVEGTILYKLRYLIETVIADEVGFDPEIFPFYRKRKQAEEEED